MIGNFEKTVPCFLPKKDCVSISESNNDVPSSLDFHKQSIGMSLVWFRHYERGEFYETSEAQKE